MSVSPFLIFILPVFVSIRINAKEVVVGVHFLLNSCKWLKASEQISGYRKYIIINPNKLLMLIVVSGLCVDGYTLCSSGFRSDSNQT